MIPLATLDDVTSATPPDMRDHLAATIERLRGQLTERYPQSTHHFRESELVRAVAAGITRHREECWPRYRTYHGVPTDVASALAAVAAGEIDGVYLAGPVGSGKTQAAWDGLRLLAVLAPQLVGGLVATGVPRLLDRLRPSSGSDSDGLVDDLIEADLLFLDDLGAERSSDWTLDRLYVVLSARYDHRRPLIVTGNLPMSELGDHVGERLASRLAEMCRTVPMVVADRRRA